MNFYELIGVAKYIYLALIGVALVQVYSNCEIMSFRSKALKINAENYVRIKQEACANLPLCRTSKTTKPNSHSLQFGFFEPKKKSFFNTYK